MKSCKDCDPATKRPAPHPGPRCATHHREFRKASSARAHDKRVQSVYGLGPGEYGLLLTAQGGVCAICQRATGKARRLAVDHDHATGEVRGLLCKPCNYHLLGRFTAAALARAVYYLADPPARKTRGAKP